MALGVFFLLSLAAIATGLQAAPGADEGDLGIVAVVATSAIALVSFFLGGFVSSWSPTCRRPIPRAGENACSGSRPGDWPRAAMTCEW